MKLNWFSPLPPARTDIANFTARILPCLARRAAITLWTDAESWDPSLEQSATVRHFAGSDLPWPDVNFRDITIYNIGNDPRFHGSFTQLLARHRGYLIFHDTNVHELYRSWLVTRRKGRERYLALMAEQGGSEALDLARGQFSGATTIDEVLERFPLTHLPLAESFGAVLHNPAEYERLRAELHLPLTYLPLPYKSSDELCPSRTRTPRTAAPDDPYRLVLFGFLHGANRRLTPFLESLAAFPRKKAYRLDIAGEVKSESELNEQLDQLGLRDQVTYHGFVRDAELERLLHDADLAVNLRYPCRGESSGSQLRIWDHSLPSLVSRTGWYAGISAACAAFVRPEHEREDIHHHLDAFLNDPESYFRQGEAGRAFLAEHHTAESYVDGLLEFLASTRPYRGRRFTAPFAHHIAKDVLSDLDHPAAREYYLDRVGRELAAWGS